METSASFEARSAPSPYPTEGISHEGKSGTVVARELDLVPSVVSMWVKHALADRTKGKTGLTTAEREELARLRKENRILQEERDILKKAAAFFAKQSR